MDDSCEDFAFYFDTQAICRLISLETVKKIGKPDLAAIPIGAYEPRDFTPSPQTSTPRIRPKFFSDLAQNMPLRIHWGTGFQLTLQPISVPLGALKTLSELG